MHYGTIIPITYRDLSIQSYMLRFLESVPKRLSQTVKTKKLFSKNNCVHSKKHIFVLIHR